MIPERPWVSGRPAVGECAIRAVDYSAVGPPGAVG